ncbi:DNA-dependent metalloprotease WSS1 [Impatiens glandulifera]|uniref:DNA-dependent metalloprotease WSS1 n=1 Tax=Impatiens glandulifera TaxID=253017 RepID=UPI001FB06B1E|nr:DNA-dependent metalloprotease WSS1 [Impatiens glandulifera]
MNLGDLHKVWEFKALKRKPDEQEALKILDTISKRVQPIMRKRKWRVKLLSEFCPKNPSLLGLNVGAGIHVKLRLRKAKNDLDFIPFEQVLDTMLHELCHNAHGPHNASFYSLWDELRKECEELMSKGIIGTGEGFDLPGKRVGGFSRQPPLSSLRKTALAAAEKRSRLNSVLPSGPKRLGGDSSIMSALSPMQAAAMAAERRYQDNMWCASEFPETILDEEEDYAEPVPKPSARQNSHAELSRKGCEQSDVSSSHLSKKRCVEFVDLSSEEAVKWECGTCTLLNPPLAPVCKVCGSEKAKDLKEKREAWTCKFCTLENNVKMDKCIACEQWRYSYGQPVVARHWS